jgi:nucleotide-binding universal stress UspA family protein
MYRHILVALDHSRADRTMLAHVERLARETGASLLLVHVADGWAARHFDTLTLRASEEMREDEAYLTRLASDFVASGIEARALLARGDPATEILRVAEREGVDLIAMATHGHRWLADLVLGATADRVRHAATIPVLLLRAPSGTC